jgi:ferredoxin
MGCTLCTRNYPEIFEMKNRKAYVKPYDGVLDMKKLADAIASCPVNAIEYIENAHAINIYPLQF